MRLLIALLAASLAFASTALAQEVEAPSAAEGVEEDPSVAEARALFDRGRGLADQRRFSEAAESFERSLALVERPSTAFNLALCHYALGRHVEAIEVLERYQAIADPAVEGEAYQDATRMLEHARRSVGTIVIEVSPADASVTVDGAELAGGPTRTARVNSGTHVVRARAPYHRETLVEVEVERGQTMRRAVQLTDERTPAALTVRIPDLPDAEIEVDGEAVGTGSARLELDAGEHRVRVTHPRMRALEQTLDLDWSEQASIVVAEPTLQGGSLADEPGLWIGVGAAALAIAGAVAIGFAAAEASAPNGGSSGVVLNPTPTISASGPMLRLMP